MGRKKRYVEYDCDSVFDQDINDISESEIEKALSKGKIKKVYATKIVEARDMADIEIYPEFTRKKSISPRPLTKKQKAAKRNLNDKNARKYLTRLVNTNFKNHDIYATFTCDDDHLPNSIDDAHKLMTLFIKRLNYERKKRKLGKARYVYVIEYKPKAKIRWHFHMAMDGDLDLDTVEAKWSAGRRNNTRRIAENDDGLDELASYLAKEPVREKNQKRWGSSQGLKKPKERKNHYMFKGSDVKKIIKDRNVLENKVYKLFPNANIRKTKIYYNSYNGLFYITVRLKKDKTHKRTSKGVKKQNE